MSYKINEDFTHTVSLSSHECRLKGLSRHDLKDHTGCHRPSLTFLETEPCRLRVPSPFRVGRFLERLLCDCTKSIDIRFREVLSDLS